MKSFLPKFIFFAILFFEMSATLLAQAGAALDFDGIDDYVSITRPVSDDFTIEFWMKTTQTGGNPADPWYLGNGLVDGEMPGVVEDFGISMTGGKLAFGVYSSTLHSTSSINTNNWVHIAVTRHRTSGAMQLFINGVLEATGTSSTNALTAPSNLHFGKILAGTNYYQGQFDEIRIWNRVLPACEILHNQNCELDFASQTGLIAYYPCNQGTGGGSNTGITSLTDAKGAYQGTLSGFDLNSTTSNFVTNGSITTGSTCSLLTPLTSTITITSSTTRIAAGVSVLFSATITNGNASPTYQWQKNSVNVGTNATTYTDASCVDGDVIRCLLTPSPEICTASSTSNPITMHADCPTGSITLSTQAAIDRFAMDYSCTILPLNLTIEGADITSLAGLSQLTQITEDLIIQNAPNLTTLAGLGQLTSVRNLSVMNNSNLANLSGLSGLSSVYRLEIANNAALTNLTGLGALTFVQTCRIFDNAGLTSLTGLSALTTLPSLHLYRNNALQNLTGLGLLTNISDLYVVENAALTSLTGLGTFTCEALDISANPLLQNLMPLSGLTTANQIHISNNAALTHLTGLGGLVSITGSLVISRNANLTNITALGALTSVRILILKENPVLSNLTGLSALTTIGDQLEISQNALLNSLTGLTIPASVPAIEISENPVLVNITALSTLTTTAALKIALNNSLPNLMGLGSLTTITGFTSSSSYSGLHVENNVNLTSLTGLGALTSATDLTILDNPALLHLTGLGALTTVQNLTIKGNATLTSLAGLSALLSIEQLRIENNSVLPNLTGLTALTTLPDISITDNALLTSLTGLESITSVTGLHIANNPVLLNLTPLESLTAIGGWLSIDGNATLTSIMGLHNANLSTIANFTIQNCPLLSLCSAANFCAYLNDATHTVSITGNAAACQNQESILSHCAVVLPVELLNFNGQKTENGTQLSWQTASETRFAHFDIERSLNGTFFEKIGETKAKGSNSNYTFMDPNPFNVTYYRLKSNDLDGKFDYSKIISIETQASGSVRVKPTFVNDVLTVEGAASYEIVDGAGRVVLQSIESQLNVQSLPQGFYVVRGRDIGGNPFVQKIIKN
jgi:Concanavalin A-like lectin/glucanases superfamily